MVDEYTELRKAIIRNVASDAYSRAEGVAVIHEFLDASIKHASGLLNALRYIDDQEALVGELDQAKDQRNGLEEERDSIRDCARVLEQERQLRSEPIPAQDQPRLFEPHFRTDEAVRLAKAG